MKFICTIMPKRQHFDKTNFKLSIGVSLGVDEMSSKLKKKKKSYSINKKLRVSIIIISVIVLFISVINLCIVVNNHSFIYKKKALYSYTNSAKVNYTVTLKPNAYDLFGGKKSLGEGNTYITNFVDEIHPSFTYNFTGERPSEISGHYQVYAIIEGLVGNDKNSEAAWQKKIIIQNPKNFNSNDNKISISTNNPIKLENYKQTIDKILKGIDIQFNVKLKIFWDVELAAKTDNGVINQNLCPTMEIPLYSNTFKIGGQLSKEKEGAIQATQNIPAPINKNMIAISATLIILSLVALIFLIAFTKNSVPDSPLTKKIKKIFKQHGDRLVGLRSILNIPNEPKVNVKDINDLVRIADEISRPIFYIHIEDGNDITKFYVIDEKIVYLYDIAED